jgi:hypothetical protein
MLLNAVMLFWAVNSLCLVSSPPNESELHFPLIYIVKKFLLGFHGIKNKRPRP